MQSDSQDLIQRYYAAFNAGDLARFLELVDEDLVHDINQGIRETGRTAFATFMQRMNSHYEEKITDLVVMTDASGHRAAAEFTVLGRYLKTDRGLPEAKGQAYRLSAGTFFEIGTGRIRRISVYYNLQDWMRQVSAL